LATESAFGHSLNKKKSIQIRHADKFMECVYTSVASKKKAAAERFLHTRTTFSQSLTVSSACQHWTAYCIHLIFIIPRVKIYEICYCYVLLSQKLQTAMSV